MTENVNSSNSVSFNALSDLNSFFRSGVGKSDDEEKMLKNDTKNNPLQIKTPLQQEQSPLMIKRPEAKEKTNPLQIDTSSRPEQSQLSIKRPEVKTQTNQLQADTSSQSVQSPLEIKRSETNTEAKPISTGFPKQKQTILYELRSNAMNAKLTAWDIAKKYGLSYVQAQEIFIELNQDKNGIVKEFNLPENSTVSYLV